MGQSINSNNLHYTSINNQTFTREFAGISSNNANIPTQSTSAPVIYSKVAHPNLEKIKEQAKYLVVQKPKWLYKNHIGMMKNAKPWQIEKQNESSNAAWAGLKTQQKLQEYKVNKINNTKQRIYNNCFYYSKQNKLGREINEHAEKMFFPLESKKERKFRRKGETIRSYTQYCDVIPRHLIRAVTPMPPGISNLVNVSLMFSVDCVAQVAGDFWRVVASGPDVKKAPNTKICVPSQTCIKLQQSKDQTQSLGVLFSIILQTKKTMENGGDISQLLFEYNGKQLSFKEAYEMAVEDAATILSNTEEMIKEYKGDTHARKIVVKENELQVILRSVWGISGGLLAKTGNTITGGALPRVDLPILFGARMLISGSDFIDGAKYSRGRHLKNPQAIMTDKALNLGLDILLPQLKPRMADELLFKHIANSPDCEDLRKEFHAFNWQDKETLLQQMDRYSLAAEKCMQKFVFCPKKTQQQVGNHYQARVGQISKNLSYEMSKHQREHALLYRKLHSVNLYISQNEGDIEARKYQQDITEQLDKNNFRQQYVQAKLNLVHGANCASEKGDFEYVKKYLDTLYVLEESYKRDEKSLRQVIKNKVLDNSVSAQLRSSYNLIMNASYNVITADHQQFHQQFVFRLNSFEIFAVDATLKELDHIAQVGDGDISGIEKIFNHHVASLVASGLFLGPVFVAALWQYPEHLQQFNRPKHHELYVKSLLHLIKASASKAKAESFVLHEKLVKLKQNPNANQGKILNIEHKLELIKYTLEEIPKIHKVLQTSIGDVDAMKNIMNSAVLSAKKEDGLQTKLNIINNIAAMASGFNDKPVSENTNNITNTRDVNQPKLKYQLNSKFIFRRNINQSHTQAIDLVKKVSQNTNMQKKGFKRAMYRIKHINNPYDSGDLNEQSFTKSRSITSNIADSYSQLYSKIYSAYQIEDVKEKSTSDLILDIFNKIPSKNIADKVIFIKKIRDLKTNLENELNSNNLNLNLNQIKNMQLVVNSIINFEFKIKDSEFIKHYESLPKEQIVVNSPDGKNETILDISNHTNYVRSIENDIYQNIDYVPKANFKDRQVKNAKNLYTKTIIPAGKFVSEQLPVYAFNVPLTLVNYAVNLPRQHKHKKDLQVQYQATHEVFFKDGADGTKGIASYHILEQKDKASSVSKKLAAQKLQEYYEQNKDAIMSDKKICYDINARQQKLEYLKTQITKMPAIEYNIKLHALQQEIANFQKKRNYTYQTYLLMRHELNNLDQTALNTITQQSMRKEVNFAPRYTDKVSSELNKLKSQQSIMTDYNSGIEPTAVAS